MVPLAHAQLITHRDISYAIAKTIAEMAIGQMKEARFARFNDAIVRRLLKKNPDKNYSKAAGELIMRVSQLRAEQKVAQN